MEKVVVKTEVRKEYIEKVEYRDIIKSVFKEVIAIYSPLSQGGSTVAAHLALAISSNKKCNVCIVDYNPLKPKVKDLLVFHLHIIYQMF